MTKLGKTLIATAALGAILTGAALLDGCSSTAQQQVQVTLASAKPVVEMWCGTIPAQDAIFKTVSYAAKAPPAILDAEAKAFRAAQAFCADVPAMNDPIAMLKAGVDVVNAINPNLIAVGLAPVVIPSVAKTAAQASP